MCKIGPCDLTAVHAILSQINNRDYNNNSNNHDIQTALNERKC